MSEHEIDYVELKKTSLWLSDLEEVVTVMQKVENALGKTSVVDAEFTVMRDDGEALAMVWWDGEGEQWLCNWLRGSGA